MTSRSAMPRMSRAFALFLVGGAAHAATITVSSNADSGANTLRAAITAANGTPAADTVVFNLAAGQRTITLATPLPTITATLDINGTSQPGFAGVPLVRIDGVALMAGQGALSIDANSSTVRGLMITRVPGTALSLSGGLANQVHTMYLGTDGSAALGNGTGLAIWSSALNTIGGPENGKHNVISGNTDNGLFLGDNANFNLVVNNRIGTNAAGNAALPNGYAGIRMFGDDNIIGSTGAFGGNLISGNARFGVDVGGGEDNQFNANHIGTDLAGTAALGNAETGISDSAVNTRIGDSVAGSGNVISGNGEYGLALAGTGTRLRNNRIGTNAAGTAALGNGSYGLRVFGDMIDIGESGIGNLISGNGRDAISLDSGADTITIAHNRIGTNTAGSVALPNEGGIGTYGSNVLIAANLVSGNTANGIYAAGSAVEILANRIGTDANGTAALPNGTGITTTGNGIAVGGAGVGNLVSGNAGTGIVVGGSNVQVLDNRVGTDAAGAAALPNGDGISIGGSNVAIGAAGAGNLISGNSGGGIGLYLASDVSILANRIGTSADGMAALGNGGTAIRSIDVPGVIIGAPGAGNLISDNGRAIELEGAAATVQSNIIGLNADQSVALPNGDASGIAVYSAGNQIGGSAAGEGNVVVGAYGIVLRDGSIGNRVEGNFIGTNAMQTQVFGTGYAGVYLYRAYDNAIGGTDAGAGNIIRGASAFGVFVDLGTGNAVLGNSLDDNGLAGIELNPIGPDANDVGDVDHGRNEGQNRPILTGAMLQGGDVVIAGVLDSIANAGYRIEFFHSDACHVSGLGEAEHFLGATTLALDADGSAPIALTLANPHGAGVITATATDADGNTSEISPCIAVTPGAPGAGQFQLWRAPFLAYEDIPAVEIAVVRSHGLSGNTSVRLRTQDTSATAPADYATRDIVLNFADGEWLKTVSVPVVLDTETEGTEEFVVELLTPTGGATLGNASADVLLFDHDDGLPFLSVNDTSVGEPASGQAEATFVIALTPSDHVVNVGYETFDGSATAGMDYTATSGLVTFQPGELEKEVTVPVLADGNGEGDETFYLRLIWQGEPIIASVSEGEATIVDEDDSDAIFRDGFE